MKRRHFTTIAMLNTIELITTQARAQNATLKATPQDAEGPFYPENWQGDIDSDLTTLNGIQFKQGLPLQITGSVLTVKGSALVGATVEIWQTDHTGKYRHSRDGAQGPVERGFQGFGRTLTDADSRYRFRTIKPLAYEGRPAHVHFRVRAPNAKTLTTQMYFANENKDSAANGFFGGFSKERDLLTVAPTLQTLQGVATLIAQFNLVLEV
jgi:protocatechuate 3,4-dioxygenase, beta subunit